jgi:putative heme-binding domain-containing protein
MLTTVTTGGRKFTGIVRSESADTLTLRDGDGKDHSIRKSEIDERKTESVSLMPEGTQIGLSLQEFADLISYLRSLKAAP